MSKQKRTTSAAGIGSSKDFAKAIKGLDALHATVLWFKVCAENGGVSKECTTLGDKCYEDNKSVMGPLVTECSQSPGIYMVAHHCANKNRDEFILAVLSAILKRAKSVWTRGLSLALRGSSSAGEFLRNLERAKGTCVTEGETLFFTRFIKDTEVVLTECGDCLKVLVDSPAPVPTVRKKRLYTPKVSPVGKKFVLTSNKRKERGEGYYYQIKAVKDFPGVLKGDLGGWVKDEGCLSHEGNAWVRGNACVSGFVGGDAIVGGDARVFDEASVTENAVVMGRALISKKGTIVRGHAQVDGCAYVTDGAVIQGNARVRDHVELMGSMTVEGEVSVEGKIRLLGRITIGGGGRVGFEIEQR